MKDKKQSLNYRKINNNSPSTKTGIIDNRYRIIKELARGGMGAVYLVNDIRLHKNWAAKIVVGLEDNELIALKKVSHPLFPRIVDSIATDEGIWIILRPTV